MEYRRDGVSANKSWFFMDDVVLCLGSGIESESGDPLVTTLNQCNYQDAAYYGSKKERVKMGERYSAQRVFSDGVGYESLDGAPIEFVAREQIGDWHDVALFLPSADVRGDVFTAQVHHKAGVEGRYAYVVRPAIDRDIFLKGKYKDNFSILKNDTIAAAVEMVKDDLVMVVFWGAGEVKSKSFGTITATAPVMVTISREADGTAKCETYDPIESGAEVTLSKR